MSDAVRTKCKICHNVVKINAMRGHTKKDHAMVITQYKAAHNQHFFDEYEKILHECGLCGEYLLVDSDVIAIHLKGKYKNHGLTHAQYNAEFMKTSSKSNPKSKRESSVPLALDESSNQSSLSAKSSKELKVKQIEQNPSKSLSQIDESSNHSSSSTQDSIQRNSLKSFNEIKTLVLHKCSQCHKMFSDKRGLLLHMSISHQNEVDIQTKNKTNKNKSYNYTKQKVSSKYSHRCECGQQFLGEVGLSLHRDKAVAAPCIAAAAQPGAVTVGGFRNLLAGLETGLQFPALETLLTLDLSLPLADLDLSSVALN